MSADSWTTCPRCKASREATNESKIEAIMATYGKISPMEWENARVSIDAILTDKLRETFREDYEFYGADSGTVIASYSGKCSTCGLAVHFDHRVTFFPESDRT